MPFGEVCIEVYVIALDGVDGHGVGNVAQTVEGALAASHENVTCQYVPGQELITYGEVEINTNVTVIHDWRAYKEIVEACSKAVIVNAHGETVPVPAGYTKEDWVDKIAEAMAYRNVTWVHTAGYPFYHYHHQENGEGKWGEEGFKRLMSHIGKSNATCYPHWLETSKVMMGMDAEFGGLKYGWSRIVDAWYVERGKPLNATEFKDCCAAIIWGTEDYDMTGAIIKFAKANRTNSFGFYVHIGTFKTFMSNYNTETNGDYYRGYVGTGAAIWVCAMRFAVEDAFSNAEEAIARAEGEGRTKGLDTARGLLQKAKSLSRIPWVAAAIQKAKEAMGAAENATKPTFIETYALPLVILATGTITTMSMALIWKRNSKKESKTR